MSVQGAAPQVCPAAIEKWAPGTLHVDAAARSDAAAARQMTGCLRCKPLLHDMPKSSALYTFACAAEALLEKLLPQVQSQFGDCDLDDYMEQMLAEVQAHLEVVAQVRTALTSESSIHARQGSVGPQALQWAQLCTRPRRCCLVACALLVLVS